MGINVGNIFSRMMDTGIAAGTEGVIEISGIFKGRIYNGFHVLVTESGTLNGEVQTKKFDIYGTVKGKIEADNITIHSSGKLIYEELKYEDIIIKDGAFLIGIKDDGDETFFSAANKEGYPEEQNSSDTLKALEQDCVREHAQVSNDEKEFMFENNTIKHLKKVGKGAGEISPAKTKANEKDNNDINNVRIKSKLLFESSF